MMSRTIIVTRTITYSNNRNYHRTLRSVITYPPRCVAHCAALWPSPPFPEIGIGSYWRTAFTTALGGCNLRLRFHTSAEPPDQRAGNRQQREGEAEQRHENACGQPEDVAGVEFAVPHAGVLHRGGHLTRAFYV